MKRRRHRLKPRPTIGAGGAFQEALVGGAHDMLGAFGKTVFDSKSANPDPEGWK